MLTQDERRRSIRMLIICLIVLACALAVIYDVERPHSGPDSGAVGKIDYLARPSLPKTTTFEEVCVGSPQDDIVFSCDTESMVRLDRSFGQRKRALR